MSDTTRPMVQAALLSLMLGSLTACSGIPLPHIVVLHDPLTQQEHVTLGESYHAQGKMELAKKEYEAALKKERDYIPALIAMGNLSFETGYLQEAEEYYRKALDVAPGHPAASNNLAMVYLSRNEQLDEAEQLAKKALPRGDGLRPYILDTLAKIYVRQERFQEARTALDEAEMAAPLGNTLLHERLAQSQRELAAAAKTPPKP